MSLFALLLALTIATAVYITLWFILAQYLNRIDVVDSAWGLGFVYVALLALVLKNQYDALSILTAILVTVWGVRLTWHISSRNLHKDEDARYSVYRTKWGTNFWQKTYTNIYLVQAVLILIVSAPVIAILSSQSHTWTLLVKLGFLIWIIGICFEAIADYQLRQFLKSRTDKHPVMNSGLWHYSRHPNYFGEVVTWFGAAVVAAGIGSWWGFIGTATIAFLILKVSGIPPIEKRHAADKKYASYVKQTSSFLPLPPKHL